MTARRALAIVIAVFAVAYAIGVALVRCLSIVFGSR